MTHTFTRVLLSALLLGTTAVSSLAQVVLKGVVTSAEDRQPLPGASVKIDGKEKGTITDINGEYKIVAEVGNVIKFSYIGFATAEKTVTDGVKQLNVVLNSASKTTSEVNIAYGKVARRELTGSVVSLSGDKVLKSIPVSSFDQAMQGRAAGLNVTSQSGVPGTAARIRIRGGGSISGSSEPLYVLDGMILTSGPNGTNDFSSRGGSPTEATNYSILSNIDPNDIENITVLKDAAATAIYGSRAANGVIIITTRQGKNGAPKYNFNYYYGVQSPTRRLPLLNNREWLSLNNEARVLAGNAPWGPNDVINVNGNSVRYSDALNTNTNWLDQVFRQGGGRIQEGSLNVSGGNDNSTYSLNGSFFNNLGFLEGNTFNRFGLRANINNNATKFLTISGSSNVTYTDQMQIPTGFNSGGIGSAQSNALPIFPVYNPNGSFFGTTRNQGFNTGNNPVAQRQNQFHMDQLRLLNNIALTFKLTDYLKFRSSFQSDLLSQRENFYFSSVNRYAYRSGNARRSVPDTSVIPLAARQERTVFNTNLLTTQQLVFEKTFLEKHKVVATGFYEYNYNGQRDMGYFPTSGNVGFVNPNFSQFTSSQIWAPNADSIAAQGAPIGGYNSFYRVIYNSLGSRLNYVYDGKYIIEGSLRQDASSNFGPNNRFGTFWAASAGWNISDESWFKLGPVNYLKLRASYGTSGNSGFQADNWYGAFGQYNNAYLGNPANFIVRLYNPFITWEKSNMTDISADFGLFNNKLTGTLSYYVKNISDPLLNRPVQSSAAGYLTQVYVNDKDLKIRGYGWEFSLSSVNIEKRLRWTTDFNISSNQNTVMATGPLGPDAISTSPGDTRYILNHPQAISYIAEFAGVDPATGREMIYENGTNNKIFATAASTVANRRPLGRPNPLFFGGLNNTFTYNNFDLSVFFSFSYGNTIYDDGAKFQLGGNLNSWNQRRDILRRWQTPGDDTDVPRLGEPWYNTSRWLYDASFLRLRTLSLGYNIPNAILSKYKINSCRLYISGQNLLTFTRYPGWDPEVTRNVQNPADGNTSFSAPYLATPQVRTVQAGFSIGF